MAYRHRRPQVTISISLLALMFAIIRCCLLLFGHRRTSFTTAFSATRRSLEPSIFIATKSKYHPQAQVVSLLNRRSSSSTNRLMSSLSSSTSSSLPTKNGQMYSIITTTHYQTTIISKHTQTISFRH